MAGKRDFYEILGVSKTASADELKAAVDKAYAAARKIRFTDCFMRSDIGKKALEAENKN